MRFAAEISYDGGLFSGWQIQDGSPSVQAAVEDALSLLGGAPVKAAGAGRTDAGVHARGQVCSFDMPSDWNAERLTLAVNAHLPAGVSFIRAARVPDDFHARYDAVSREYIYFLWLGASIYPQIAPYVCWYKSASPDWSRAAEACAYLEGEHDFHSFCRTKDLPENSVRVMHSVRLRRRGNLMWLRIKGSGFLTNMVRSIMGDLELIARGKHRPEWINELYRPDAKRTHGGRTFPPRGLFLWKINYGRQLWK